MKLPQFILFIGFAVCNFSTSAQVKLWTTIGVTFKVTDKQRFGLSQQTGFGQKLEKDYILYNLSYAYRTSNNFTLSPYIKQTFSSSSDKYRLKKRYGVSIGKRFYSNEYFRLGAVIYGERHSLNESKYRHRFISRVNGLSKKFYLSNKVKLRFKSSLALYYNHGGESISQYAFDNYVGEFSPHGFHRSRISFGMNFQFRRVIISTSILRQIEFNTAFATNNRINVVDFYSGRIKNRFRNNTIISISARYSIRYVKGKEVDEDLFEENI